MIRINLLAEGRRPVAAKQVRLPRPGMPDLASLLLLAGLVVGVVVALGHNYLLGQDLENKTAEVAEAQREVDELAPVIKEVEEFKAKKAELENKVQIVNNLKANQPGPVRIMDYVSRALPELLWLKRMEVGENKIVISGEAFNTNAVANFIENLDKVPVFQEPNLKDTSQRGPVYTFVVEFSYSFTGAGADADARAAG